MTREDQIKELKIKLRSYSSLKLNRYWLFLKNLLVAFGPQGVALDAKTIKAQIGLELYRRERRRTKKKKCSRRSRRKS